MSDPRRHPLRPIRFLGPVLGAILTVSALGAGSVAAVGTPETPMVLQNIPLADIVNNKLGICNGSFTHVMKNSAGPNNVRNYLNAAQKCGLKVIFTFPETVNYSTGRVYPSKVAYWVNLVKAHPALFGYLSVKEPSWHGISATEIRSLYSAFRKADPNHPVIALLGDTPNFNKPGNYWGTGMANILAVDWYPVETSNRGCSRTGTSYVSTGPKNFANIKTIVARKTPGTPIWLMVQTHKNLAPACHKKQRPSESLLRRQVRDGFRYLGASGIAFHTWTNSNYQVDERRDPTMVSWMKKIANQAHAGTFE
ncbi:MAG: hypothetical protein ACSLFN_03375 [Candidatus Limnocylindrales bacterium]